ncbi:cytochrome P450 [Mycena belliarum]|uniref:Cytochrome P450 n=1 Tax=Mycena belliarum TaxID=1033014 RepID=A0AAD6UGG9_9AGAR|nr:cytochrome P450 [Mycena belliae]
MQLADVFVYSQYLASSLIALPALAFGWHILISRRWYAGEPSLEAGWIPWLGVGLQMRKMEEFALKNYKKHGRTFAAYAAGQRFVFSEDLAVHKEVVTSKDFGLNQIMVTFQRRFLFVERASTAEEEHALARLLHSHLSGKPIAQMRGAFLENLIPLIESYRDRGEVDLIQLMRETIFTCTMRAIFGNKFPADKVHAAFEDWDHGLQNLMTGKKDKAAIEGLRVLEAVVDEYLRVHLHETASVIQVQFKKLEEIGTPWTLRVKFVALALTWAGLANVTPVGSWAVAFMYRDPELQAILRDEISMADASLEQGDIYEKGVPSAQLVAQEAIRLTMLGSIVRPASKNTVVEGSYGPVHIRRGDLVMCTSWSMHRQFENPEEFIWDRLRPVKGEELPYFAFGGGPRPCPGKSFAYSEIKMVTLAMLERYDVEPLGPFPQHIKTDRIGVGVAEPSHPWKVRLIPRF